MKRKPYFVFDDFGFSEKNLFSVEDKTACSVQYSRLEDWEKPLFAYYQSSSPKTCKQPPSHQLYPSRIPSILFPPTSPSKESPTSPPKEPPSLNPPSPEALQNFPIDFFPHQTIESIPTIPCLVSESEYEETFGSYSLSINVVSTTFNTPNCNQETIQPVTKSVPAGEAPDSLIHGGSTTT